jgi:hypothetical protein
LAPILEGDHLVGYHGSSTALPVVEGASGPVSVSQALLTRSFHATQMPDWIWLPEAHAMIVDVAKGSAGESVEQILNDNVDLIRSGG